MYACFALSLRETAMPASLVTGITAVSELLSTALAIYTAHLMLRLYRIIRRDYLLGFPIGFTSLALSYSFYAVRYVFPSLGELAGWLGLMFGTYGFAFIAGTYFLRKRSEAKSLLAKARLWFFSLGVILLILFYLLIVVPLFARFPAYQDADDIFRLVNVALLTYTIFSLNRAVRDEPRGLESNVLLGFLFLTIGQYTHLIYALEDGSWSLVFTYLLRILGLVALAESARPTHTG
jgi:hypothetical protein